MARSWWPGTPCASIARCATVSATPWRSRPAPRRSRRRCTRPGSTPCGWSSTRTSSTTRSMPSRASSGGRTAPRAVEMLARLGTLLRLTLERDSGHEVTLGRELELLDLYLDIERTRFSDRLQVDLDVPSRRRSTRVVPAFVLQPLVENAIRHGIAPVLEPGWIRIARLGARRHAGDRDRRYRPRHRGRGGAVPGRGPSKHARPAGPALRRLGRAPTGAWRGGRDDRHAMAAVPGRLHANNPHEP